MKKIQKLFQIAITAEPVRIEDWSSGFKMNVESFKNNYPDADYQLYQDADLTKFLSENFDSNVVETYHKLKPYAFKADLARYCLLYIYGGLYSDLSYLHISPILLHENTGMVLFRDIAGHPSWAVSNAIIYSEPGRKELKHAIDMIVNHAAINFYGDSCLDVSGPYLFGRALAEVNNYQDIVFGDSRELTPNRAENRNIYKILPTGDLIAFRNKKEGGQIADYGVKGANNYAEMWNQRQVWAEKGAFDALLQMIKPVIGLK
jgi:hypothetical protein